jgi:hypothetical protein
MGHPDFRRDFRRRCSYTTYSSIRPAAMPDFTSCQVYTSIEQHKYCRPKRRFSALLDSSDHSQLPSKRHCRSTVSDWLDTLPSPPSRPPRRRCSSAVPSYPSLEVSRRSRSAPAMTFPFAMPSSRPHAVPTPPSSRRSKSTSSHLSQTSAASTSSKTTSVASQVNSPLYRQLNLESNDVLLRESNAPLPSSLDPLMIRIRADRDSPPPDISQWDTDLAALEMGRGETDVEACFKDKIFLKRPDPAFRSDKKLMFRDALPQNPHSYYRVVQPVPDVAYGYTRDAFTEPQWTQIANMGKSAVANNEGLVFPFLVVEMKADGPHGSGSLWVATNQCLGGAALCVNLATDLYQLPSSYSDAEVRQRDGAAFSIALSGTEARLFITWRQDAASTRTQRVGHYLVQRHADLIELRKNVLNIFDWGRTERLQRISHTLDETVEARRMASSAQAKSRPSPVQSANSSKRGRSAATWGMV